CLLKWDLFRKFSGKLSSKQWVYQLAYQSERHNFRIAQSETKRKKTNYRKKKNKELKEDPAVRQWLCSPCAAASLLVEMLRQPKRFSFLPQNPNLITF